MEWNGIERALLEEISRRKVVRKYELVEFLRNKIKNIDEPIEAVEAITKCLYNQGLITYLTPLGKDCCVVTQKGLQFRS